MKKADTLVIGQGIAGTLVAFMLHKNKVPFLVIDPGYPNTSSRIAAGMFTPISGKRKTAHALVQQQINYAIKIYKEIEELLGLAILHQNNIYQVLDSEKEQTVLAAQLQDPRFAKYIVPEPATKKNIKHGLGAYEITHSGWVNCGGMIDQFAQWLKKRDALIKADFLYKDLQIGEDVLRYRGLAFNNIIFCEGYRGVSNPFFAKENIIPCGGDILTIKCNYLVTDQIIKKNGIYLIPAGKICSGQVQLTGGTTVPSNPMRPVKKFIIDQLNSMLEKEYELIGHKAAVRPTTYNREVITKQHFRHKGMFMLNGLGTKGILQGPWWADVIVKHVCAGIKLGGFLIGRLLCGNHYCSTALYHGQVEKL